MYDEERSLRGLSPGNMEAMVPGPYVLPNGHERCYLRTVLAINWLAAEKRFVSGMWILMAQC